MVDEHVVPLKELQHRFEVETAKSLQLARANPRLGVPQVFNLFDDDNLTATILLSK